MPKVIVGKTRVWVRTPYNAQCNDALKAAIPYPDLQWDRQRNCWKLAHVNRGRDALRVLFRFFNAVLIEEKGKPDRVIDSTGREVRQETLFAE
jgi:hypothetical protein